LTFEDLFHSKIRHEKISSEQLTNRLRALLIPAGCFFDFLFAWIPASPFAKASEDRFAGMTIKDLGIIFG